MRWRATILDVFRRATAPHPSLGPRDRSQAQTVASLALTSLALTALVAGVSSLLLDPGTTPVEDPLVQTSGLVALAFLAAYWLSRGRHPALASWVFVAGIAAGVWFLTVTGDAPWSRAQMLLLIIPVLASLVLNPAGVALVTAANLVGFGAYSATHTDDAVRDAMNGLLLAVVPIVLLVAQVQRLAQQDHIEAQAARLAAEEADIVALLEAAPHAMMTVDPEGRIRYANKPAANLLGYARDELLRMKTEALLPRGQRDRHAEQRAAFQADPAPRFIGHNRDLRALRKDGTEVPVEVGLNTLESRGEQLVVVSLVDLSLRREAERLEIEAVQRDLALQKTAAVAKFRADLMNQVAHELKNPLTPLRLQVHLLGTKLGPAAGPDVAKSMAILDRNVSRLVAQVEHMLEAARLESGTIKLALRDADLSSIVRESCHSYKAVAQSVGVHLQWDLPERAPLVCDVQRLAQLVDNLVSNAIKYTPTGGRVTVKCRQESDLWVLRVADTGLGLTPEQIEVLFRPFSKVHDPVRPADGSTGLGLYITHGIAALHGGRLGVDSPGPGQGSTFWVRLPPSGPPGSAPAPTPVARPLA